MAGCALRLQAGCGGIVCGSAKPGDLSFDESAVCAADAGGFACAEDLGQGGSLTVIHFHEALLELAAEGKNPLQLDSRAPSLPLDKYAYNETRYTMLTHSDPRAAKKLLALAQEDASNRWKLYQDWATQPPVGSAKEKK